MVKRDKLIIFDTTLRDGEQCPGASMTLQEKVTVAKALERLKVDVIEAGFPISSPGDFAAVEAIAKVIKDATVCGLSRCVDADIEQSGEALKSAASKRIHIFIATSKIHMERKLKITPQEVLERAVKSVKKAKKYTDNIEFSPEDAGRSELDFLCQVIEAVIKAGATTINIPDTVGYNLPHQYGALIANLIARIPNADKAIFSTHCHNDLGMAVANSLAGVLNGARQVECTINGIGERAGNASLEEVVMAVRTRQDIFSCDTRIDATQLVSCSKLVSSITGFVVQPNKAIVGVNAFAHESGIHQDGVMKSRETYEIMRAEDVGWKANRMVLGKHSGRNALKAQLETLGYVMDEAQLNHVFVEFKNLADKKHEIFDEDLIVLMSGNDSHQNKGKIKITHFALESQIHKPPVVTITLDRDGKSFTAKATGNGPVEAAFKAIENIMQSGATLQLYTVNAVHAGADAQGTAKLRLEKEGKIAHGQGTDTDVVFASIKAYIEALNYLHLKHGSDTEKEGV